MTIGYSCIYGYLGVTVQWACCQPPPGCGLLLSESASPSLSTGCHCSQEGGGQSETSVSDVQWCSELSSGWSHTTSTTTLWVTPLLCHDAQMKNEDFSQRLKQTG